MTTDLLLFVAFYF